MKKTSELLVAEWERTGQGADIGDLLDLIDTAEDKLRRLRREHLSLLKVLVGWECECDLDMPCTRCQVINEWHPGMSTMDGLSPDAEAELAELNR